MVIVSWMVIGLLAALGCSLLAIVTWASLDATRMATKLAIAVEALDEIRGRCIEGEYTAAYDLSNDIVAEIDYTLKQLSEQE
jgi:hypothetical protein